MHPASASQVVVVGGGPAGSAVALALRRLGVSDVLLVEAGDYQGVRFGESIPPESRLLLDALGLWQDFLRQGHEPCLGSCSTWASDHPGYNDFLFNPHGHGWHLDRRRFDAWLADSAVAAGVERHDRTRLERVEHLDGGDIGLRLSSADGPRFVRARFVVDATGSSARLARSMGATRWLHDTFTYVASFFEQPAVSEVSRLTLLEAVEYGWWYAARLPAGRVAVAVASDAAFIKREALHRSDVWRARLDETRHIGSALAGCTLSEERVWVRTALSCRLDRASGHGWLAVGDAAAACDPISSRGIYQALQDGLRAAETIKAYLSGAAGAIEDYNAEIAARYEDYLGQRNYFYAIERRWPSAPFWERRRRRATATALTPS